MELKAAERLASQMMAEHGLSADLWKFRFYPARRAFGCCQHNAIGRRIGRRIEWSYLPGGTIRLSSHLVEMNDESKVRATILHEIAHALAGPRHGHDAHWRAIAISIGDDGARCYEKDTETPEPRFTAECPLCGKTFSKFRRPKGYRWCRCTFHGNDTPTYLALKWKDNVSGVVSKNMTGMNLSTR